MRGRARVNARTNAAARANQTAAPSHPKETNVWGKFVCRVSPMMKKTAQQLTNVRGYVWIFVPKCLQQCRVVVHAGIYLRRRPEHIGIQRLSHKLLHTCTMALKHSRVFGCVRANVMHAHLRIGSTWYLRQIKCQVVTAQYIDINKTHTNYNSYEIKHRNCEWECGVIQSLRCLSAAWTWSKKYLRKKKKLNKYEDRSSIKNISIISFRLCLTSWMAAAYFVHHLRPSWFSAVLSINFFLEPCQKLKKAKFF